MRVAFFYPGFESLSLEMLSAALKMRGHEARLFYDPQLFDDFFMKSRPLARLVDRRERLLEEAKRYRPDLIGFSVVTHNYVWAVSLAARLKEALGVPVVFGGPHPTLLPEQVLENGCVDHVVRGEGEFALLELLEARADGGDLSGIRNLCHRRNGTPVLNPLRPLFEGLETLPPPDKSLYLEQSRVFRVGYQTITGRGCPYRCAYCLNNYYKTLYPKDTAFVFRRTPEDVLEELAREKADRGLRFVMFVDENFCAEPDWTVRFLEGYRRRIDVPFWCLVHPNTVTAPIVAELARSHCVEVQMGVETVNMTIKKRVLLRGESNEAAAAAIDAFRANRIRISTDNILNTPGTTPEDLTDLARFYLEHTPDRINSYWLLYFPKIAITRTALEMGLVEPAAVEALARGEAETAFFGGTQFDRNLAVFPLLFFLICFVKPLAALIVRRGWVRHLPFIGFRPLTGLVYGLSLFRGFGRPRNAVLQKRTVLRYLLFLPGGLWHRLRYGGFHVRG